jgi:hypothetical protein
VLLADWLLRHDVRGTYATTIAFLLAPRAAARPRPGERFRP